MRVNQIMSHPVLSAPVGSSVGLAARLMWEYDIGIVPLVDEEGRLAGVITDRDICMAAYTQGHPLGAIAAASAMAGDVVTCRAEDTIEQVAQLMREHRIRRVPVLDRHGSLVGIVSLNDIARAAGQAKRAGAADRELVSTLARISQPRTTGQRDTAVETSAA